MAIFNGTLGSDTIVGTAADDILAPIGSNVNTPEYLSGLDGADQYSMYRAAGTGYFNYIIDDQGTDGAADSIIGSQSLYQLDKYGVETFATAERIGMDLEIHLPSKAWAIRDRYIAPTDIKIVDHYGDGQLETLSNGYITYTLGTGNTGTAGADIMAGDAGRDRFKGGDGGDWVFGNGGRDRLALGKGDDYGFGGDGNDVVKGQAGNDYLFGDAGNDTLRAGGGNDQIDGGIGNDRIVAGGGSDTISGGTGDNRISTGGGADVLVYANQPGGAASHDTVDDFNFTRDRIDVSDIGLVLADLSVSETAQGDAVVSWDSGAGTGPELTVELLGVQAADVTADMFLFV